MIYVIPIDNALLNKALEACNPESVRVVRETVGLIKVNGEYIAIDNEGVHTLPVSEDEAITIPVYLKGGVSADVDNRGGIVFEGLTPISHLRPTIKSLLNLFAGTPVPVVKFVRTYGTRLEANFACLCDTLDAVGLDTSEDRAARKPGWKRREVSSSVK